MLRNEKGQFICRVDRFYPHFRSFSNNNNNNNTLFHTSLLHGIKKVICTAGYFKVIKAGM